jgi:putative membrane protein
LNSSSFAIQIILQRRIGHRTRAEFPRLRRRGERRRDKRVTPVEMSEGTSGGGAESRTHLAEDRTILANERTFAGWVRTSLGCIAIGVGFHALFNRMEPSWLPRLIATAFLLLAAVIVWLAVRRATAVMTRLSAHVVQNARKMNLELIATAVSAGALALAVAVWLMPIR